MVAALGGAASEGEGGGGGRTGRPRRTVYVYSSEGNAVLSYDFGPVSKGEGLAVLRAGMRQGTCHGGLSHTCVTSRGCTGTDAPSPGWPPRPPPPLERRSTPRSPELLREARRRARRKDGSQSAWRGTRRSPGCWRWQPACVCAWPSRGFSPRPPSPQPLVTGQGGGGGGRAPLCVHRCQRWDSTAAGVTAARGLQPGAAPLARSPARVVAVALHRSRDGSPHAWRGVACAPPSPPTLWAAGRALWSWGCQVGRGCGRHLCRYAAARAGPAGDAAADAVFW